MLVVEAEVTPAVRERVEAAYEALPPETRQKIRLVVQHGMFGLDKVVIRRYNPGNRADGEGRAFKA